MLITWKPLKAWRAIQNVLAGRVFKTAWIRGIFWLFCATFTSDSMYIIRKLLDGKRILSGENADALNTKLFIEAAILCRRVAYEK